MLRLNAFIRPSCEFIETSGNCKVTGIAEDPEHCSLSIVDFVFDGDN